MCVQVHNMYLFFYLYIYIHLYIHTVYIHENVIIPEYIYSVYTHTHAHTHIHIYKEREIYQMKIVEFYFSPTFATKIF